MKKIIVLWIYVPIEPCLYTTYTRSCHNFC